MPQHPALLLGSYLVLLERALQLKRDGHVFADEHPAGLEGSVPGKTEVFTVDDRLGRSRGTRART